MEAEVPCVEPIYQRLAQLVARAFYAADLRVLFPEDPSEKPPPGRGRSKKAPADFTGLGIVVVTGLLYRPWWEEEEFARKLGLPMRPVRQILRLLETHSLVAREHRKERRRRKEGEPEGGEALPDGDVVDESAQERGNLISYCSLDYQRLFDMARYRIHRIHRRLREDLEDKRAVQEYVCPGCARTYTTLQAPFLIKPDGLFHCEECDGVLEASEGGEASGVSRRERTKLVKAKQAKVDEELRPLMVLLAEIEKRLAGGEQIPDFGTLAAWAEGEARRAGVGPRGRAAGAERPSEPEISIAMAAPAAQEERESAAPRVLPPWLLKQQQQAGDGHLLPGISHAASHGPKADLKDDSLVKDSKEEEEAMRLYKARMAQFAAGGGREHAAKRQKTEDGWHEAAGSAAAGGWQEVPAADGLRQQPAVKQEAGAAAVGGDQAGSIPGDDDDWEDA